MAIAWLYREDYGRAGFPMLPVIDPQGLRAARQSLAYGAVLVPVSVLPTVFGVAGAIYLWIALALGVVLLWLAARFMAARNDGYASITYLPLIWIAMIADKL
jgi:protoheme IX farnesyltransferase